VGGARHPFLKYGVVNEDQAVAACPQPPHSQLARAELSPLLELACDQHDG